MVVFAFILSALVMFGIAVVLTRPTPDQKALDRRLASLKSNADGSLAATLDLDLYLKTLKRGHFGWLEDTISGTAFSRRIQLLIIQSDSATAVGTVLAQ